jgi:hypothetical protein
MNKKLFTVVFFKNHQVIGSEVFFEEKVSNIYSYLGFFARSYQPDDYNIFEFDNDKREYIRIA